MVAITLPSLYIFLQILPAIALPNILGFINGHLMRDAPRSLWYKSLNKPSWMPPGIAFPIVWPILYTLMGFASYLVWNSCGGFTAKATVPLALYAFNQVFNHSWTTLFFLWHQLGWALVDCTLIWITTGILVPVFYMESALAGWLMVPYFLWSTLAEGLSIYIYKHNKKVME